MSSNPGFAFVLLPPFWPNLPPLGIACLSEILLYQGIEHQVFDLNILSYQKLKNRWGKKWTILSSREREEFAKDFFLFCKSDIRLLIGQIKQKQIMRIGFSLFELNEQLTLRLIRILRREIDRLDIFLGGPQVLYRSWENKDLTKIYPEADYLILGEGEGFFRSILMEEGNIFYSPAQDLNSLPLPSFKKINLDQYSRKRALPVMFSRGCVNRCTFCAECRLFKKYQHYQPEKFVEYLQEIQSGFGLRWVTFYDSLINGDLNALEKLCRLMIQKKLNLHWDAQLYINSEMSPDLLRLMKESGCFQCFIGLESGSDDVLERMNKRYTSREAALFFRNLKKAGLFFEVSLIVGFPGETQHDFQETLDFIERNHNNIPKIAQMNPFINLPGTPVKTDTGSEGNSKVKMEKILQLIQGLDIYYTDSYINNLSR